jgi:hypothetical protein
LTRAVFWLFLSNDTCLLELINSMLG